MSSYDAFARFYDLDTEGITADLPFWVSLARRTGGPVLEVACGTGRVLVPLARAGFSVVGVDLSAAMLGVARDKIARAGLNRKVELAEPGAPERALERIRAHLALEGVLALDLPNPVPGAFGDTGGLLIHEYTRDGPTPGWRTTKLRSQELDPVAQRVDVSCIYDELTPAGE